MSPELRRHQFKDFEPLRNFEGQHIVSARQFDKESLDVVFGKVEEMKGIIKERGIIPLSGYILASLFLESSTQTKTALEAAMLRLGGNILEIPPPPMFSTSTPSQEGSLESRNYIDDTIQMVASHGVDIIALRHPHTGAAEIATQTASVPIINAGDGIGENPGQGLSALYTIWENLRLDGATVTLGGNLKYSRTLHSLAILLSNYKNVQINLVPSANYLRLPDELVDELRTRGAKITQVNSFEELADYGVVVLTRVEGERVGLREESAIAAHLRALDYIYPLTPEIASKATLVLSPIPRKAELETLPQTAYYRRIENGVAVRMALLSLILKGN